MHKDFYEYAKQIPEEKKKNLGIIYTPAHIVDWINSSALSAWQEDAIPKIVDPCCGTGVFLYDMAHKISDRWGLGFDEVCRKYIYGFDLDEDALVVLKTLMPHCNVSHANSLKEDYDRFDIIVTNPPYIRIQNLDIETREFLQKSFDFCEGDTDIYIAFFEKFAKSEKIVGMICPNSWIRNKGTKKLRQHLYNQRLVSELVDFKEKLVFDGVQTYTSIVVMPAEPSLNMKFSNDIVDTPIEVCYDESAESHMFSGLTFESSDNIRNLLDYCDIKVGLATLCDKVYFGEVVATSNKHTCIFETKLGIQEIERAALRRCIKASKISQVKENTYIIFPYDDANKLISEADFKAAYPLTHNYLQKHKTLLLNRDKGKIDPVKWHGYGRTQGLANNKEKLLVPPMHKDKLALRHSDKEELYISGYAIFPKEGTTLLEIQELFETEQLYDWITQRGKSLSGGWYGISKELFKTYNF